MVPSPLFLSPSESSASAIENMNSYKENEKRKDGAKIQFCAINAKMAQDYLCKLWLAPSIKCKVLHCAATKTTLVGQRIASRILGQGFKSLQGRDCS